MAASFTDISRWFDSGVAKGATHLIVKCDSFDRDSCCYPVFVDPGEDVRDVDAKNKDRTMEVYNLSMAKYKQLSQTRAFNY